MKRTLLSASLAAASLSLLACPPSSPGGANAQSGTKAQAVAPSAGAPAARSPDAVKVEFYVMSQCPYGVQVVNGVKEAVDKLGPDLDLSIDYIGSDSNGTLTSMHGPDEVTGDMVQLCAKKAAPAKYLDMLVCQNKEYRAVARNWEACAQEAKLPVEQIRTCLNGDEGKELLKASFKRAQERQATGSPTIFVAGKPYNGRRGSTDFLRAFCAEHKGASKPQACQNIPEPPKVNVTIIGDKRCPECKVDAWANNLKSRLASPVLTTLEYTEPEGRRFYDALGENPGPLPMVLFDSTLDADKEASSAFGRYLQPRGSYRMLMIGGEWNPTCMNEGGCKLEACKATLACKPESPKTLDVYVMSQCPFGVRALNAMDEVLKNFNGAVNFSVHYIANGTAKDGFQSLHGQAEVDENIRGLCAMKLAPKNYKWMDYVLCRNKDINSKNWQTCAGKQFGFEAKAMERCVETEGKKLLESDIKHANALSIGASPTWIANGKHKFSGADAETIKARLCEHNKGLKGCEKTLSGPAAHGAAPQGNCGK